MAFLNQADIKRKNPNLIGNVKFIILILIILFSMLARADNWDEIDKLSSKCQAGKKEACAKLVEIAKNDEDPYVRRDAVKNLTDQVTLAYIAKNDANDMVRLAAAYKLNDKSLAQDVYADIAKNVNDYYSSGTEIYLKKITDQALLSDIAKNAKNSSARSAAVEKLSDQPTLAYVAKNDKDSDVRWDAVEKLTDQTVLAEIAKTEKDLFVLRATIENPNLTDLAILVYLYKNSSVYEAAQARIIGLPLVKAMIGVLIILLVIFIFDVPPFGRIGRLRFTAAFFGGALLATLSISNAIDAVIEDGWLLSSFLLLIGCVGFIIWICSPFLRIHDLDLRGFWWLLLGIPVVNIIFMGVLLFKRGTEGFNRFGDPNKVITRRPGRTAGA